MSFVFIKHKVRNFAAWRSTFDQDGPRRAEAGFKLVHIFRSRQDLDEIALLFEAPKEEEKIRAFLDSRETLEQMRKSAAEEPEVLILETVP